MADSAVYLGDLYLGVPADQGSTLYVKTSGINEQFVVPPGGELKAYLVTAAGYPSTALANYTVKMKTWG